MSPDLTLDFLRGLWRLNHAMERRSSRMYRTMGITAQQRMVLRLIAANPGISAGALAELLHIDRGTMSTMLGRLEERELVDRRRHSADARRTELELTSGGSRLANMEAVTIESAADSLVKETDDASIAQFLVLIERFSSLLESDGPNLSVPASENPF